MNRSEAVPQQESEEGRPFHLEGISLGKNFRVNGGVLRVLEEVRFRVSRGEFVCILGRSGCGKTTLLKVVAGFLPPSSGRVLINGRDVRGPGSDRCVVFQEDALFPWLTVRENVTFGLTHRKRKRSGGVPDVDGLIESVGLARFKDYLPREISGGMKQRVALARVLVLHPEVLLMDEPFASLDSQTRREMQELLIALWEQTGHTVLFVTHDIEEALLLADRILIMDKSPGRIREEIPVALPRPRRPETAEFLVLKRKLLDTMGD